MSDFARRCEMLKELGIKYWADKEMRGPVGPERKYHDIDLFKQIRPPFDAETWMSLCTNDGDNYMGGCCGTMSALQDKMEEWFRFHINHLDTRELEEAAEYWIAHGDGAESWVLEEGQTIEDLFPSIKESWEKTRPWDKLGYIWLIVKGHHNRESISNSVHPSYTELEKAMNITSNISRSLGWAKHSKDNSSVFNANQTLALSQLLPGINNLYRILQDMLKDEKPFNGFTLIDLSYNGDDNISRNRHGLAVFATLDEANEELNKQQEYEDKYEETRNDIRGKPVRERFGIRPVRITLSQGLEFTGELINDNSADKN